MSNEKEKPMKLMAYAALLVMFLMGSIVGGILVRAYDKSHMPPPPTQAGNKPSHRPGQGGPGGPGGMDRFIDRLRTELKLTDDQTKQVKDIMAKSRDQFQQLRNDERPKFLAIREQNQNELKSVLTPEQQTKLQQLLQDDRDRGDRGGDHDHDGQGPHQH